MGRYPTVASTGTVGWADSRQPELPGQRLTRFLDHGLGWLAPRPWLAAIPIALVAAGLVARRVWLRRRQTRLAQHARYLTITPPAQVEPVGAAAWWANL